MKIGLVCPYNMFEHHGGVQQLVIHLADGLKKKGHQVKIITPRPAKFDEDAPKDYILLGTSRRVGAGMATKGDVTFEVDSEQLEQMLAKEKFDVINFHEPWSPILARQILSKSETAHVGTFHANLSDYTAGKSFVNVLVPYGRSISEKLHALTAVSKASAAVLLDKGKNNELVSEITYIPNGIDLSLYKPYKKRVELSGKDTKTILYIGRLERRKGVEWLIKAFAEAHKEHPDIHLIIAGEGNRRTYLEQLVTTLKLNNVEFLGYISDEHKRYLLGNADLFCSPAMFGESFGIVLLEAMAMGSPVIAGRNNGYSSVLGGHGAIGLVDSEATSDFAARINLLLYDEVLRKLLKNWAAKDVKNYDYPKIISQYELVYLKARKKLAEINSLREENARKDGRISKISSRLFIRRHVG